MKKIFYLDIHIRFDADDEKQASELATNYMKDHVEYPGTTYTRRVGLLPYASWDWNVTFFREREEGE